MSQQKKLLQLLEIQGAVSSTQIQAHLAVSQATVSRLIAEVADEVIVCGKGKSTKYALAHPIGTAPSQQPIWMINAAGLATRLGTLSLLSQSQIHIDADGVNEIFTSSPDEVLPWYLSTLKAQGFLGRLLAHELAGLGVPDNPERWDAEAALIGAIHTLDAPGAMLLGTGAAGSHGPLARLPDESPGDALDALTLNIAKAVQPGSSAGGEQPKILVTNHQGDSFIVKFTPPLGTPFGDRWADLLRMEAIANDVLNRYGFETAKNIFVKTKTRAYLLSQRFDRAKPHGRLHVVSLGAVHHAFVKGAFVNWAATCDALARQGRLPKAGAETIHAIAQFGKLIGNSDMHFGNASLFVGGQTLKEIVKGQFRLAPVYDMLPMRWRPDQFNGISDYTPFKGDDTLANEDTRQAAREFWNNVATDHFTSQALKEVAVVMIDGVG